MDRLYDVLEMGEFKTGELVPRIKTLLHKKEEVEQVRKEAEEALSSPAIKFAERERKQQRLYRKQLLSNLLDQFLRDK